MWVQFAAVLPGLLTAPRLPAVTPRHAAVVSASVDFSDPTVQQYCAAAVTAALGGGILLSKKGEEDVKADPAPPPPPPAPPPAPIPKSWPLVGGSGGSHRMRGPYPRTPPREQWIPPPGWKPPTKPVTSWYDRGDRLVPPAPPPAAPTAAPPSPPSFVKSFDDFFKGLFTPGETQRKPSEWPAVGGSGASHPMRGPWPRTPTRELWEPPPGWTPPAKTVWPAVGGSGAWHPMRGPWPRTPTRELWEP